MESKPANSTSNSSRASDSTSDPAHSILKTLRDSSGIALFMVIAAISVLAILVTEFTYISQVNRMIAVSGLDQVKAHYMAKSGLKLSLLRLKAYQKVKGMLNSNTGGFSPGMVIPKTIVEKIWTFPFTFPIPTELPGMTSWDKDVIKKFQKDSNLDGSFTTVIESESSKLNLNMFLSDYATPMPTPTASGQPQPPQNPQNPQNPNAPNQTTNTQFDAAKAQENLFNFLQTLIRQKSENDTDFAMAYRDLRLQDLVYQIVAWADRTYQGPITYQFDKILPKKAPFYSVSELHMLPGMDDELYNLFASRLTASRPPGLNVNTIDSATLGALIPEMNKDELKAFVEFRSFPAEDHFFKEEKDFYGYLQKFVASLRSDAAIQVIKDRFKTQNIVLKFDETEFRIVVRARVNQAQETIEAWVSTADGSDSNSQNLGTSPNPNPTPSGNPNPNINPQQQANGLFPENDSGLRINYMRIL